MAPPRTESHRGILNPYAGRFRLARRAPASDQRLFRRYLGVTPKWVLQRYRLHAAAERIAEGEADLARLAHDLGYFDQAYLIKDFKALVGRTPAEYAAECAQAAAALAA